MFERSEFGRRTPLREEHRGPGRLYRPGERPAQMVLVPFAETKGTRARSGRKPLILPS